MPPGLTGLPCDGPRVRSLPFSFFTKRYRPVVLHVAAYLDAMGAESDLCRWDHPGTIASAIGYKERAVELAFKTLTDDGWLKVERQRVGDHDTNVYWMLWRIPSGGSAPRAEERPSTESPGRERPTVPIASARPCAPTCASTCADPGLSPSTFASASAPACAETAHAGAPPSIESCIQGELYENVTERAVSPPRETPEPKSPPKPPLSEAEIAKARQDLTHRIPMFRRTAATALAAVGLCPAEFLELVNKEEVPAAKPTSATPTRAVPTSTVEMIAALADPTHPIAIQLVVNRMVSELNDWLSRPWIEKILGQVRAGSLDASDLAKCYAEAKRQTKTPAKVYFGRGVKSLPRHQPTVNPS